jgi:hypothetical protein
MRRLALPALVAALLPGAPVQAQEARAEEARPPEIGLYFGAFIGGAALNSTLVTPAFTFRDPQGSGSPAVRIPSQRIRDEDGAGFIWGLRGGFLHRINGWLAMGIEGETTFPQAARLSVNALGQSFRGRLETEGTGYLRAGWTLSPETMLFARVGIAVPRQVVNLGRRTVDRWTPTPAVGLGLEHRFQPRMSVRADLTFSPALVDNQIGSLRGTLGVAYHF